MPSGDHCSPGVPKPGGRGTSATARAVQAHRQEVLRVPGAAVRSRSGCRGTASRDPGAVRRDGERPGRPDRDRAETVERGTERGAGYGLIRRETLGLPAVGAHHVQRTARRPARRSRGRSIHGNRRRRGPAKRTPGSLPSTGSDGRRAAIRSDRTRIRPGSAAAILDPSRDRANPCSRRGASVTWTTVVLPVCGVGDPELGPDR